MEAIYAKLYDKYTKLKIKKESEIDKISRDQEVKFMNYVSAADELVEHLRNENDRLRGQINDLRHEVASIRSTKDEQQAAYQKLLMEEDQKIKQLSEEIERLQNLQSAMDEKNENRQLNMFGSYQIGSDTYDGLNMKVPRKRSRNNEADAEVTVIPCSSDQVRCDPVNETPSGPSKQIVSSINDLDIDQPECCRRKIGLSGGVAATGPSNCIFQELTECLLDMKLSTATQTEGICISALHQSSGYSFSLTWANKAGGDEVEVLYRVLSLGTFERVAPEWMREVIVFSLRMCPIFFERISELSSLADDINASFATQLRNYILFLHHKAVLSFGLNVQVMQNTNIVCLIARTDQSILLASVVFLSSLIFKQ